MINEQYKYSELTSKVIGCAMKVQSALGNGFQEVIYQRALAIEFSLADIPFSREFEMPIFYHNQQIGTRRVDFLVNEVLSVEIKAITKLEDVHFAQAINYLEAYNLEVGLLINFGERSLNFKRLQNKKFKNQTDQTNHKNHTNHGGALRLLSGVEVSAVEVCLQLGSNCRKSIGL